MASNNPSYEVPTCNNWNDIATFYHPLMAGSIDGTDVVPHDHAVVRAMYSKYKPNKRVSGDPLNTIMVRHIALETRKETLEKIFSDFGKILSCRVVRDLITGKSKGYGFIEFDREKDARNAVRESRDLIIDRNKVVVDFEAGRTLKGWIPRRFGGGFGGKKESGQLRFGGIERPFRRPISLNSKPLGEHKGVKRNFEHTRDEFSKGGINQPRKHFRSR